MTEVFWNCVALGARRANLNLTSGALSQITAFTSPPVTNAFAFAGLVASSNFSRSNCNNQGTCVDSPSLNSTFTCSCDGGYSGTYCQTDINECASLPCSNGGTCIDQLNGFVCVCVAGFSGVMCQTDVNECASGPCTNGATCVDHPNSFTCLCVPGFSGLLCQTDVNECASQPCVNSGTCVDHTNSFSCTCVAGYSGTFCQTDINECGSTPCANSGTCVDNVNFFTCICPIGYSGLQCQTEINECDSQPCQNGATCLDHLNGYGCVCAPGFQNATCGDLHFSSCVVPTMIVYTLPESAMIYRLHPQSAQMILLADLSFPNYRILEIKYCPQTEKMWGVLANTTMHPFPNLVQLDPFTGQILANYILPIPLNCSNANELETISCDPTPGSDFLYAMSQGQTENCLFVVSQSNQTILSMQTVSGTMPLSSAPKMEFDPTSWNPLRASEFD